MHIIVSVSYRNYKALRYAEVEAYRTALNFLVIFEDWTHALDQGFCILGLQ